MSVPPATAQGIAAPPRRGITRDQLVQLARAGKPWEFVPLGIQAVRAMPADHALRFLVAANFAQLGLGSLAREFLGALPHELQSDPDVLSLGAALDGLPDDRLRSEDMIARCEANVRTLLTRRVDLTDAFEHWKPTQADVRWLAARDGHIVRIRGQGGLELLADHAGLARRFIADRFRSASPSTKPYFLEGVDPPWLLIELAKAASRHADGFAPAIFVLQQNVQELLDGLALADLSAVFSQDRVMVFAGADAPIQLQQHLRSRLAYNIAGDMITLPSVRERASPPVADVVARCEQEQAAEAERLHARVESMYAGRDEPWWAQRFQSRLEKGTSARPLRVLIPTSRYSTFIKHSSADLRLALERAGCEARLLIEPDDAARLSSVAYLRAIAEFEPDLIITINYTRANINTDPAVRPIIPPNLPFVCWIQDAMAHLFDANVGRRQSPLDFIVGHIFPELTERYAYPEPQTLRCSAGAELQKFHDGPVPGAVRARVECEIGYVSNHSEPPQALRTRLSSILGPAFARAESGIIDAVEAHVRAPLSTRPYVPMHAIVTSSLRDALGADPDPRLVDILTRQFADPYADRLIRHDTLRWAAEIAERRGWRLRIFGRGWLSSDEFTRFASGELPHGEDLRAAYQCAVVQLHMTQHTLVHQRVFECLLSGGFPLLRMHQGEFEPVHTLLLGRAMSEPLVAGASAWPMTRHRLARFCDNPGLAKWAGTMAELGLLEQLVPETQGQRIGLMLPNGYFTHPSSTPLPQNLESYCAFLHLSEHSEHFFHSKEMLERRIAWAIEHPEQRDRFSRESAQKARSRKTYDALASDVLSFVRDRLSGRSR